MKPRSRRSFLWSFAAVAALALGASGCHGYVPFTQELVSRHDLGAKDLQGLQFYLSDEIVLRREIASQTRQIAGSHRLVVVSGKTVEEVVIPAHTPGIAVEIADGSLAISFEPGSSLRFVAEHAEGDVSPVAFATPPDPFPGNRSEEAPPLRRVFEGAYRLALDTSGRVAYQGLSFVPVEESAKAHLLIRVKALDNEVESRKVLRGMKLEGR